MHLLRKYRTEIIVGVIIIAIYFATRLYSIMSLPLFTDEAIYTRWSQIARFDGSWRFISLTDGKQPSFVWLNLNLMRLVSDPLLSGRLVSVFAGFMALIGTFLLSRELFKSTKVGLVAVALLVFYPFALVYDRMALYESLVTMFSVWALYFHVLLVRTRRLDIALILGMILGGGVLTKTSGFLSVYLSPFILLLFNFAHKDRLKRFIRWIVLLGVAIAFTYGYYSIQRLSPFFHIIEQKNSIFIYPLNEWVEHPTRFVMGNLSGMFDWLSTYMTYPVIILVIASFFIKYRKFYREKILLFIWFLVPFVGLAVFARLLYPRFIYFMTIPLLILAAYSLVFLVGRFKSKILKALVIFGFLSLFLRAQYIILTDFAHAPIPKLDLEQYINGWPAGGGLSEVVEFLEEKAKTGKIYVMTEGTFGSVTTYATEIYLDENKNIEKRGLWPLPEEIPEDLVERSKEIPVYVVLNETQDPPPGWPIKLIERYQKGVGDSYLHLYQVITPE